MANDRVTVSYSRRQTQTLGEDVESYEVGGSIEFDMPEGASNWMSEYNKAYAILRLDIDGLLDGDVVAPKAVTSTQAPSTPKALPGERLTPRQPSSVDAAPVANHDGFTQFDESAKPEDIVVKQKVFLTDCRVFNVEVKKGAKGPWVTVRVGSRESIPGQYTNLKSFDPAMVNKLRALEERDMVNAWGYFEPWKGNEDRDVPKFDFFVERVERINA